jgi:hypothetical protein
MRRVFHIPSHLTYVAQLTSQAFVAVSSPTGQVLRIADLLLLDSWDFFDVLHLHTVELADLASVHELMQRLRRDHKRVVVTAHDLVPNIESPGPTFVAKMRLAITQASTVITLTSAAAQQLAEQYGIDRATIQVLPHGAAVPLDLITDQRCRGDGFAAYGALRPNRRVADLVRAWRTLPPGSRLSLRLLLRSVGAVDRQLYADDLDTLHHAALIEPDFDLTAHHTMLPTHELVAWVGNAAILVLPYHQITHSGQLELARDLGLPVMAPDVPTLRAQLTDTADDDYPVVWTPQAALENPTAYARYLVEAMALVPPQRSASAWREFRAHEQAHIVAAHEAAYAGLWGQ